ncbi:RcnB family protein [Phenylobacterium sp.]|uniref:RcnB family protein n=1 Tax=Phenylobacterium sp. TaxID=1871053 RepID=UPI002DE57B2E|nr:RcnB family protein [Phenylobacterium sp.]
MKTRIAALALLLMAGTATTALAQDHDKEREQRPAATPHEHHGPPPGAAQHAPAAPTPPQAHAAPIPPQPRGSFGGRWGGPPSGPGPGAQPPGRPQAQRQGTPGYDDGRRYLGRPGRWVDTEGDDTSKGLSPADQADHEDRDELRQWRRYNNDRQAGPPTYQGGRRPDGRPADGDRRGVDHPRDNPRWEQQHSRDRDHRDHPQWRPGAFPPSFASHHRFRDRPYRRPPHFFVHAWSFGEFLPPAWYGPEYLIADWWDYDLPAPPYGYDWVRVGDDAVLVEDYSGRIVQVVRALFW